MRKRRPSWATYVFPNTYPLGEVQVCFDERFALDCLWHTIYLSKLPRLEKTLRVALDWTLDLLFSKDLCQFIDVRQEHRMSKDILRNLPGAGRGVSPPDKSMSVSGSA